MYQRHPSFWGEDYALVTEESEMEDDTFVDKLKTKFSSELLPEIVLSLIRILSPIWPSGYKWGHFLKLFLTIWVDPIYSAPEHPKNLEFFSWLSNLNNTFKK